MTYLLGNSSKSLAKSRNGQVKLQKFAKGGGSSGNGQRNSYSEQRRGRGFQNPQKKGDYADKRPPARALRQTERFDPVSIKSAISGGKYLILLTIAITITRGLYIFNTRLD